MKKVIRKWGSNGLAIYFNTDERKIYNLSEGDFIDIEITKIKKPKNFNSIGGKIVRGEK